MKCVDCSNGVAFGCKYCVKCFEKAKIRSAERYKKMKLERKCKSCKGDIDEIKYIYCKTCRDNIKTTAYKRKNAGMCITCGKTEYTKGQKCDSCHEDYLTNTHKKKQETRKTDSWVMCILRRTASGYYIMLEALFTIYISHSFKNHNKVSRVIRAIPTAKWSVPLY